MLGSREHARALVTFGSPGYAMVGRETVPLVSDDHFVARFTTFKGLGDVTILADEAGDVYVAR